MTVFGITIPVWFLVVAAIVLWIFRNEVAEVIKRLFSFILPIQKKHEPSPEVQQLVWASLQAHGVNVGDVGTFDGKRLVALLRAFGDFLGVIAKVTPNQADNVVVAFVLMMADALDRNQAIADLLARFINVLVYKQHNQNQPANGSGNP